MDNRITVRIDNDLHKGELNGRLILLLSPDPAVDPLDLFKGDYSKDLMIFGQDVEGWQPGAPVALDSSVKGFPCPKLAQIPSGQYRVQCLFHHYEFFNRADGHRLLLPMDRGEGQQWRRAPGNLLSESILWTVANGESKDLLIPLTQVLPEVPAPRETDYVKFIRIQSPRLSTFWGRPMHLGAHVLLPHGFADSPGARYPLVINHGHFPSGFDEFRETPPDPDLEPIFSERFQLEGYNRIEQKYAYSFYKYWRRRNTPPMLLVKIQHPTPYYDDSYAVNSANMGPYGDAINFELLPAIEETFRGIGQPWSRFLFGGSTGGWASLASQVFYPDLYNGCYAACPDPVDFSAFTIVDLYRNRQAYYREEGWGRVPRPGFRNHLGEVFLTLEDIIRMEQALGSRGRSGEQYDAWDAVYSPVGDDGYPRPVWNKESGEIDSDVVAHWRENYDLAHIIERDWATLGAKLQGKIHVYCGDMDNFYLNNAVKKLEGRLRRLDNPRWEGVVDYGRGAEHCWSGDHTRPNATARLRYFQFFAPKILKRLLATAPPGTDLKGLDHNP